jgi:hypothetical protein
MKAKPRVSHLSQDRRRALQLIASTARGTTEDLLVLAHGFSRDTVAGLVLAGLLTVVTETLRVGGPTVKVERVKITDDGRSALEG